MSIVFRCIDKAIALFGSQADDTHEIMQAQLSRQLLGATFRSLNAKEKGDDAKKKQEQAAASSLFAARKDLIKIKKAMAMRR